MLLKYHFKIKHIKRTNNARVDIFSRKVELQGLEKPSGAILKFYKDRKIKYNYLKLVTI